MSNSSTSGQTLSVWMTRPSGTGIGTKRRRSMSIKGQLRAAATAAIPAASKASCMSTPTIGLSPTATSAPASRKTSIAAAITSGCVTTPEPGAATRPTFGLSNTRLPRTGDSITASNARRVFA